jgi:hypothetical protein
VYLQKAPVCKRKTGTLGAEAAPGALWSAEKNVLYVHPLVIRGTFYTIFLCKSREIYPDFLCGMTDFFSY